MSTVSLSLDEIFDLAKKTLLANGCDDETASILSDLIRNAERDGSLSHGLFRLPAYVSGLKSGKINGKGKPEVQKVSPSVIKVKGNKIKEAQIHIEVVTFSFFLLLIFKVRTPPIT